MRTSTLVLPLLLSAPAPAALLPHAPAVLWSEGEDISPRVEEIRADAAIPGLVVLAMQDGEVVLSGAAGVRTIEGGTPLEVSDAMHLGSCAKAMTATLAGRLVEAGKIDWDTPLAEVLPELAAKVHEDYRGVTLAELLRHRAGIAERRRPEISAMYEDMRDIEGTPAEVRLAILERVLATAPLPPAEAGFDYSNFGYMLAGSMLEARGGAPWEELIVTEVFEPLELESAGVGSPGGELPVRGHFLQEDGTRVGLPPGPGGALPDAMGPAGLVHANLADWARFVEDHLAGARGTDGLLTSETYQLLHQDVNGNRYAAGWGLQRHTWSWGEGDVLTHNGSDGSWMSVVYAMPEWDLVVVAAANCGSGDRAVEEARLACMRALGFLD